MELHELLESRYKLALEGKLYPSTLAIETTNICNASCIMCPRHSMTRPQGIMSSELHRQIIGKFDFLKDSIKTISHAGIGEPLIDKGLHEKIKYEKEYFRGVSVNVYTNGSLMDADTIKRLRDAGTDMISVSVNAYYEDTYNMIMKLPMEKTLANIFQAIEELKGSKTELMVSMIPLEVLKSDEIDQFVKFWNNHGIRSNVPPFITWGGKFDSPEHGNEGKKQFPCFYLWDVMLLDYQGCCRICCEDFDSKWSPGNVLDERPESLFNSDYMNRFRRMHIDGNFKFCPLCDNCIESGEVAENYWGVFLL